MQNLLIIEDDIIQSHFIVNHICKEISNIRLYNIAATGKEAINIIKEQKVDIIILDLKLPDMYGIDILNYILENNIIKYVNSVIVITGEMYLISKIVRNKLIFNYHSKIDEISLIINDIKELVLKKEKEYNIDIINKKIQKELYKLNYNFSYIGTKYLCEIIYECHKPNNIYNINLNKEVYPIISKKYNKTINSIKCSIFKATYLMYYDINESKLTEYFGYKITSKPKTKDIIYRILEKIK